MVSATVLDAGNTVLLTYVIIQVAQMKRTQKEMARKHEDIEIRKPTLIDFFSDLKV